MIDRKRMSPETQAELTARWREKLPAYRSTAPAFWYGFLSGYLWCGAMITAILAGTMRGSLPWWLYAYWTVTWLYQAATVVFPWLPQLPGMDLLLKLVG